MDIKITSNARQIVESLDADIEAYRKNLEFQVFQALSLVEAAILQNLRVNSGLHVITGALINSVPATKKVYQDSRGYVFGEIGSEGVPYAAIHEYGGTTRPHDIFPRSPNKALRFMFGGKETFARIVHHPGSKIPARPYLHPALASTQQKIVEEFGLFLKASFPPPKG